MIQNTGSSSHSSFGTFCTIITVKVFTKFVYNISDPVGYFLTWKKEGEEKEHV